jgi:hypothetical protein
MDRTAKWSVGFLAFPALALAFPSPCQAHALNPVYYALGPYSLLVPLKSSAGLVPIFVLIAIQAVILRVTVSHATAGRSLWGAAAAFIASKVGESIPGMAVVASAPQVMWSSDSFGATVLTPLLLFGTGMMVNVIVIWRLFRAASPSPARVLGIAGLLSLTSYVLLGLSTLGLLEIGWMR